MTVSEATVREELEWQEKVYEINDGKLDEDPDPTSLVSAHNMVAGGAQGIGICELLQGKREEGVSWFAEAADRYLSFDDAVGEYEDAVSASRQAHRPTHYKQTLHAALVSGDDELIRRALRHPLELDEERYLAQWGDFEFHHVLYYVKALAHFVDGDPAAASSYLTELDDVDHDYENYEALQGCLSALVDGDRDGFVAALAGLLSWHDESYGHSPSSATDFVCVDATALLALARREGMNVGPGDFDEDLREYLPEALFE